MLSEAISTVYLINDSHQSYHHSSLPNGTVLLTSLSIYTKVFFLLVSEIKIAGKGKQAISSSQNFLFQRWR
jgi:hypothetical protein